MDLKALHAKIGELTLENDFLEGRSARRACRAQDDDRPEWLGRNLYWTINYGDADSAAKIARYRRNLRSVRWNFWHYGRSRHARWFIALSRLGSQILSHRNEIEDAGSDLARMSSA